MSGILDGLSSPVSTRALAIFCVCHGRDLDDELAADFSAEVLMLAALRHPNVCLFMGACVVPPNRAIVTELLTRGSLWEALRDDALPAVSNGRETLIISR